MSAVNPCTQNRRGLQREGSPRGGCQQPLLNTNAPKLPHTGSPRVLPTNICGNTTEQEFPNEKWVSFARQYELGYGILR